MSQAFEIILENSILLIFFLSLRHQVKFQNNKLAWVMLVQLLLAYNFYVILTQLHTNKTVAAIALVVFIVGLIGTTIVSKKIKHTSTK